MKKPLILMIALCMMFSLYGCAKKIVHCDGCGREIELPAGSNTTEDWIVLCEECKAELGQVVEPRD